MKQYKRNMLWIEKAIQRAQANENIVIAIHKIIQLNCMIGKYKIRKVNYNVIK